MCISFVLIHIEPTCNFIKKSSRMSFLIFLVALTHFVISLYTRFPIRSGHCHVYNSYALQTIEHVSIHTYTHRLAHICILPQSPSLTILIFMSCIHNMVVMTVESGFLARYFSPVFLH